MKSLLRFALEVLIAVFLLAVITVFVDHRKANQRLMLLEYTDSLQYEKLKELVEEHNKLVKCIDEIAIWATQEN